MTDASGGKSYARLFAPLRLAGKQLKNRIVFPAVLSNYAQNYRVSERLIPYYGERAQGGAVRSSALRKRRRSVPICRADRMRCGATREPPRARA